MRYYIITILTLIFYAGTLQAQSIQTSVISPTGSSFSNGNFSLHFSVGEPLNTYIKSNDATIAQGVLQMPSTNSNNQSSLVGPEITCPQETVINICAPVGSPAAMAVGDFDPVDDQTDSEDIVFAVEDDVETQEELTIITRQYIFTDSDNNSTSCEVVYHIANSFIEAPVIDEQQPICAEDNFSGVKLGKANYRVYANENGSMGDLVSTCTNNGLLCPASDLGVDANIVGSNELWITEFITFPDGSICESAASSLRLEVLEKPTAELSQPTATIQSGDVLNLMSYVQSNSTGYWSGQGVFSVETADGSPLWIFSGNTSRATKLYYNVSNQICTESYLLVVNVESGQLGSKPGQSGHVLPGSLKGSYVQMYPNPVVDYLNLDVADVFKHDYRIQLYNMQGALVKEAVIEQPMHSVDVQNLNAGNYVLHLIKNNETVDFLKVVKQ